MPGRHRGRALHNLGFGVRVKVEGFRFWGSGFRVQGSVFSFQFSVFRVQGAWIRGTRLLSAHAAAIAPGSRTVACESNQ